MNIQINNHSVQITENKTDIFALSFEPSMNDYDNSLDWAPFTRGCSMEVSLNNFNLTSEIVKEYMTKGVMEIGVSRNGNGSFTTAILRNKPDHIPYVGIDIEDKSYLNDDEKKIYTIRENSYNQENIRKKLKDLGIDKISILFIDGDHSVNTCINDMKYADLLDEKSIILFHDTNYHPGPRVIIEAIDQSKFRVERFFVDQDDYGMAVAYRI